MKFIVALAACLTAIPALASPSTVSYDRVYDNRSGSLTTVACSDGANGLITRGYTTFGSLPSFPRIGGAPAIRAWNSSSCGTCWSLTYTNAQGVRRTINVLGIDVSLDGFNIALAAVNELTNNQAIQFGRVNVDAVQVNPSVCGL